MISRFYNLLVILLLILLCSCASNSKKTNNTAVNEDALDFNNALEARGFYLTPLGNINFLGPKQCGNYQLQSHRGAVRFPENSINAVIDALDNAFDVVEIDVRLTRDDVWVVHHDALTGRETGTVDNKRRKIESLRYEKEWGYLRSRDQHSGQLLDIVPPNFRQVARAFALNAKPGQLLNIEIKTHASQRDLEMLDFLAFKYIGKGRYFYSSLTLSNLERMRAINPDEFLSFIQSPAKRSLEILRNDLEKGVASDPIFLRNKDMLEDIAGFAIRRYKEHRYDDSRGMAKLKTALKHNYGLAIDIRQYAQRALSIKTQASRDGITVATYTINGHEYQAQSLLTMNASSRPTSVIIDDTLYGFCSQYDLPKMKSYSGSTALTKRMAALPEDLDLERLSELNTYYGNGLYPAINGQLKSITGKATSHNYKPVILKTQAGPKEARTTVELESKKVIKIELRKESND